MFMRRSELKTEARTRRGAQWWALGLSLLRYPAQKSLMLGLVCLLFAGAAPAAAVSGCQGGAQDVAWVEGYGSWILEENDIARALRKAAGPWMLCEGRVTGKDGGTLLGTFRLLWSGGLELRVTRWAAIGHDIEIRGPGGTLDRYQVFVLAADTFERGSIPISLPVPFQPSPLGFIEVPSDDSEVPGMVRIEHDQAGRLTRFLWRIGDPNAPKDE